MAEGESGNGEDRRTYERFDTQLRVDYTSGENFLFAYITNISEMGIFVRSDEPKPVGTTLKLRFGPADGEQLSLEGEVVWINPLRSDGDNLNPGMGIRFNQLSLEMREKVVSLVRAIAYLQEDATAS